MPFDAGKWPFFGAILSVSFLTPFGLEQIVKSIKASADSKRALVREESDALALEEERAAQVEEIRDFLLRCPENQRRVLAEAHGLGGTVHIDTMSDFVGDADALCHKGLLEKADLVRMPLPRMGLGYLYKVPRSVWPILDEIVQMSLAHHGANGAPKGNGNNTDTGTDPKPG